MGALGTIRPNGDFDLALTIRTFAVADGRIHLWVGGGIVWDSDPAAEIEESWVKARPLLAARRADGWPADRGARVTLLAVAVRGRGVVSPEEPALHADDEALIRGRAAFETTRVYGGRPFRLDDHLARLVESAARIGLPPVDPVECAALARDALAAAGADDAVLRIYWTAGREGQDEPNALALVSTLPGGPREAAASAGSASSRSRSASTPTCARRRRGCSAGVKSTSYAVNMAAEAEARRRGADDAIFLARDRIVLEGPVTNVWWRRGATLFTPSLELGILAGVTRRTVMDEAARARLRGPARAPTRSTSSTGAEEAFTSSSVREIVPILSVDDLPIAYGRPGPAAIELQGALACPRGRDANLRAVRVLSIIHGRNARSGVFGDAVRAAGHELEERSFALGDEPEDVRAYDALIVLGGSMNVHEEADHPWMSPERRMIEAALDAGVPTLGVCLGSQLLAAVAGARVYRVRHARDRLVRRRDDAGRRAGPAPRRLPGPLHGVPVAQLRDRPARRRGRARAEPGLPPGLPARRDRVGHPVPRRGDAGDPRELDRLVPHGSRRRRAGVRPGGGPGAGRPRDRPLERARAEPRGRARRGRGRAHRRRGPPRPRVTSPLARPPGAFRAVAREKLARPRLQRALDEATGRFLSHRVAAWGELEDVEALRDAGHEIRSRTDRRPRAPRERVRAGRRGAGRRRPPLRDGGGGAGDDRRDLPARRGDGARRSRSPWRPRRSA